MIILYPVFLPSKGGGGGGGGSGKADREQTKDDDNVRNQEKNVSVFPVLLQIAYSQLPQLPSAFAEVPSLSQSLTTSSYPVLVLKLSFVEGTRPGTKDSQSFAAASEGRS